MKNLRKVGVDQQQAIQRPGPSRVDAPLVDEDDKARANALSAQVPLVEPHYLHGCEHRRGAPAHRPTAPISGMGEAPVASVLPTHGCDARATLRAVTTQRIGIAAALLTFDATLLLIVGAAMWSEPPFPAEEAVGKGLLTLGVCLAIPAFVLVCAYLNVRYADEIEQEPARSDLDVA